MISPVHPRGDGNANVAAFTPEQAFLLRAIRSGIQGQRLDPSETATISSKIDWDRVFHLSFENRVAPIVQFAIARMASAGQVPDNVWIGLRSFFYETAKKNLQIRGCLQKITAEMAGRGIEAAILKGGALAFCVWPSMSLRQMQDIDLVVRPNDLKAAAEALEAIGYVSDREHSVEWYVNNRSLHLPEFRHREIGIEVELHQYFSPNAYFDADQDQFWSRSEVADLGGFHGRALCADDMLIHLCLHVTCSHFLCDNLRSLLDITLVSWKRRDSIDPERWTKLLTHDQVAPLLSFPLYLAITYLGAKFDPRIEELALSLSPFVGKKRALLEKAGRETFFAVESSGFRDVAQREFARNIIFRPSAGYVSLLIRGVFSEQRFRRTNEDDSIAGRAERAIFRFGRILRRAVSSLFGSKRASLKKSDRPVF